MSEIYWSEIFGFTNSEESKQPKIFNQKDLDEGFWLRPKRFIDGSPNADFQI